MPRRHYHKYACFALDYSIRYEEARVVNLPEASNFHCCLCLYIVSSPKKLNRCGHIFCHSCIIRCFRTFERCPLCRGRSSFNEIKDVSKEYKEMLSQLKYRCIHPGCIIAMGLPGIHYHQLLCPKRPQIDVRNAEANDDEYEWNSAILVNTYIKNGLVDSETHKRDISEVFLLKDVEGVNGGAGSVEDDDDMLVDDDDDDDDDDDNDSSDEDIANAFNDDANIEVNNDNIDNNYNNGNNVSRNPSVNGSSSSSTDSFKSCSLDPQNDGRLQAINAASNCSNMANDENNRNLFIMVSQNNAVDRRRAINEAALMASVRRVIAALPIQPNRPCDIWLRVHSFKSLMRNPREQISLTSRARERYTMIQERQLELENFQQPATIYQLFASQRTATASRRVVASREIATTLQESTTTSQEIATTSQNEHAYAAVATVPDISTSQSIATTLPDTSTSQQAHSEQLETAAQHLTPPPPPTTTTSPPTTTIQQQQPEAAATTPQQPEIASQQHEPPETTTTTSTTTTSEQPETTQDDQATTYEATANSTAQLPETGTATSTNFNIPTTTNDPNPYIPIIPRFSTTITYLSNPIAPELIIPTEANFPDVFNSSYDNFLDFHSLGNSFSPNELFNFDNNRSGGLTLPNPSAHSFRQFRNSSLERFNLSSDHPLNPTNNRPNLFNPNPYLATDFPTPPSSDVVPDPNFSTGIVEDFHLTDTPEGEPQYGVTVILDPEQSMRSNYTVPNTETPFLTEEILKEIFETILLSAHRSLFDSELWNQIIARANLPNSYEDIRLYGKLWKEIIKQVENCYHKINEGFWSSLSEAHRFEICHLLSKKILRRWEKLMTSKNRHIKVQMRCHPGKHFGFINFFGLFRTYDHRNMFLDRLLQLPLPLPLPLQ